MIAKVSESSVAALVRRQVCKGVSSIDAHCTHNKTAENRGKTKYKNHMILSDNLIHAVETPWIMLVVAVCPLGSG